MKHTVKAQWLEKMTFESRLDGHKVTMDVGEDMGGDDLGPRPKRLMLLALAGCTGLDIVSILKKMRVEIEDFDVQVEGELTEEQPQQYCALHVIYEFKGENLPMSKLEKAVKLSEDKYCGVRAVYAKVMPVTSEVRIIE